MPGLDLGGSGAVPAGLDRVGRALCVAAGLAAVPVFWPEALPAVCDTPREHASTAGWTTAVACAEPGPETAGRGPAGLRGPARLLFGLGLDANAASAATLETLPGIGPALAGRLVAARGEGAFCRAEDLERVHGIGPVLSARIAPDLVFTAAACASGRSGEGSGPPDV